MSRDRLGVVGVPLRAIVAVVVLVAVVGFPGVCLGVQAHALRGVFGSGPGGGAGDLSLVLPTYLGLHSPVAVYAGSGVAVDQAGGDVFVADTGNRRVDEFDAAGGFVLGFGAGVEGKGGGVCTVLTGCVRGLSGGHGALASPRLLAVDNSGGGSEGDVYVGEGVGKEEGNELQVVEINAVSGSYTLSFEGHETGPIAFTDKPEGPHVNESRGVDAEKAQEALEMDGLAGEVNVIEDYDSGVVDGLKVEFVGGLADRAVAVLGVDGSKLLPAGSGARVLVEREGSVAIGERVAKFAPDGKLVESWASSGELNGEKAAAGAFGGGLEGLAVDGSGDLWVLVSGKLYEFHEDAEFVEDCGVASTSASGLVVQGRTVYVVTQSGAVEAGAVCGARTGALSNGHQPDPGGFAVDEADENVFVDAGSVVEDASPGCVQERVCGVFGGGSLVDGTGVAVEEAAGANAGLVFAVDAGADDIAAFKVSLEANALPPSGVEPSAAVLNGEVNPKGTEVTHCVFQYGETAGYGGAVECAVVGGGGVGSGSAPVQVHAAVSGLAAGREYHYRLRVENKNGEEVHTVGEVFPTVTAAVVEEEATEHVEENTAHVVAKINPEGLADTECAVEYGPTSAYGSELPCEPKDLAGTGGVVVSRELVGLEPETGYHWRVRVSDRDGAGAPAVVHGADETFVSSPQAPVVQRECPNEGVRGQSDVDPRTGLALSLELADCRGYELVSPLHENGAEFSPVLDAAAGQIAADGDRVITPTDQCFGGAGSCTGDRVQAGVPTEFVRTPAGWLGRVLAPPASVLSASGALGWDADTGMVIDSSRVPGQASDAFFALSYESGFQEIGPLAEKLELEPIARTTVLASADLSHVVFKPSPGQGAWPTSVSHALWEYVGLGNTKPLMVETSGCGASIAGDEKGDEYETLSKSGEIVFFSTCNPEGLPALYARVNGETPVDLSGRSPVNCSGVCASAPVGAVEFEGASEDGSMVYFTSTHQLTNEASKDDSPGASAEGEGCIVTEDNGCNLYLYTGVGGPGGGVVDVSAGDRSGLGPLVQGVMGVSADGSHVYFVARGVLAGTNGHGGAPVEGADNLYVYERDAAHPDGRTVFIATLPDAPSVHEEGPQVVTEESDQWESRKVKVASVSPDGETFVFTSRGALTGDVTRALGPEQVYRYVAGSEELVRVSVGMQGFDDDGNAGVGSARLASAEASVGQPRRDLSMSDDGRLVFFQSPVGLTPRALNDVPVDGPSGGFAQNIYEWEADGVSVCRQPAGCVYLISDGQDVTENGGSEEKTKSSVELMGVSANGGDVFFRTADRLVGQDSDSELDIYDARVDGGFPAPDEPVECAGEECREEGPAPGVFGALPSEAAGLIGNLPATSGSTGAGGSGSHPQTPGQRLAAALRVCRRKHARMARQRCERQARARYAPPRKHASKSSKHTGSSSKRTGSSSKRGKSSGRGRGARQRGG